VVAEEDVSSLLEATSLLPKGIEQKAESIRGVDKVTPILSQFIIILDLYGKKQPAYMVGYDPKQDAGRARKRK